MALEAGSVFSRLGAVFDRREFDAFGRAVNESRRDAARPVTAKLEADVDRRGFSDFREALRDSGRALGEADKAVASFNRNMAGTRNAISLLKWPALIGGAGLAAQALSAAAAGAGALASGLAPVGGLLAAVPGGASTAAQGLGTFQLATLGVTDALGGLGEEIDKDKLKQLERPARQLVRTLDDLKPRVRDLQRDTQRGLFPGLLEGLQEVGPTLEIIERRLPRTARILGQIGADTGSFLGRPQFGRDLNQQMAVNERTLRRAGDAGIHFAHALQNIVAESDRLQGYLTRQAIALSEWVDEATTAGRRSGGLEDFLDETIVATDRLKNITIDLGSAFVATLGAGYEQGSDLLRVLEDNADEFREWTESAEGQNAIRDYFEDARPAIDEAGRLMVAITRAFFRLGRGDQVAPLLRTVRVELLPAIEAMVDATTREFMPAFLELATETVKLFTHLSGTSGPLVQFTRLLGKIVEGINWLLDNVPGLNAVVVTMAAGGGIYKALNIAASITGIKSLIGLLRQARGVAAGTAAAEGAATAAGAGAAARAGAGVGGAGGLIRQGLRVAGRVPGPAKIGIAAVAGLFTIDEVRDNKALQDFDRRLKELVSERNIAGLRSLRREFERFDSFPGGIDKATKAINRNIDAIHDLDNREVVGNLVSNWRRLRDGTDTNMRDVREQIRSSMRMIRTRLGEDTEAGQKAAVKNFRLARRGIRDAMKDGTIDVRDGTREIRRLMVRELRVYGLSANQARQYLRSDTGDFRGSDSGGAGDVRGQARGGWVKRAIGGWIGGRGMVSDDVVPIAPGTLAAYGEYDAHGPGGRRAVINRHQAPVVELALAAGGYPGLDQLPSGGQLTAIERALAPLGGLDRLFASITRPHFLQSGGIVPVPGSPGERAASSVIPMILSILRRFPGLVLTDAFGPGHKSPGHTVTGTAADFSGPDRMMDAAVRFLTSRGILVGYDGRFGSQAWPGHGPSYVTDNYHLHAELGGAGNLGAAADVNIKAPKTRMRGLLGGITQGALNLTTAGANKAVEKAIAASLAVPMGGGHSAPATGSARRNQSIARAMLSRFGWGATQWPPLQTLWQGESGWNENAVNPSSGAGGIPQALPASKMGPGWQGNAAQQIRWGLGYIRDRYGSPSAALSAWMSRSPHWYSGGGFLRRLNGGGFLGGTTTSGITSPRLGGFSGAGNTFAGSLAGEPLRTLRLENRERIGDFEDVQQRVEDLGRDYSIRERRYNFTDEALLDPDTGEINQPGIDKRVGELDKLIKVRERIVDQIERARRIAKRVIATYTEIIRRLRRSLRHAKKKDRGGIRAQIRNVMGKRDVWKRNLVDLGFDLRDARNDVRELQAERGEVAGTRAEPVTAEQEPTDDGGAPADEGTPEQAPPSAEQIAAAATSQLRALDEARAQLYRGFGANFRAVGGRVEPFEALAGPRAFGAFGAAGGAGGQGIAGPLIVNNFAAGPEDAHQWTHRQRFTLEGLLG